MKGFFSFPIVLLLSCTATKLTSSWTSPSAGANNYKKILVVSILANEDTAMRRKMESHMAADLRTIGYDAVTYSNLFKEGELRSMRYDSIRNRLSLLGIDGVVTITLMAKEKERIYVKDKNTPPAENSPLGSFWDTQKTVKQGEGKGGFYLTTTQYYWETAFYDVYSISLLYNARSTAFEVTSSESLAHKYGKLIVEDMQKNYVLMAKR